MDSCNIIWKQLKRHDHQGWDYHMRLNYDIRDMIINDFRTIKIYKEIQDKYQ